MKQAEAGETYYVIDVAPYAFCPPEPGSSRRNGPSLFDYTTQLTIMNMKRDDKVGWAVFIVDRDGDPIEWTAGWGSLQPRPCLPGNPPLTAWFGHSYLKRMVDEVGAKLIGDIIGQRIEIVWPGPTWRFMP